jgi:hypothetical protein
MVPEFGSKLKIHNTTTKIIDQFISKLLVPLKFNQTLRKKYIEQLSIYC